jgi:Na+-translocating ferredoxin:NAD+ oxidoreductase RnfD subunit
MRAKRADVSLAFLFFYSAMIFARSLYLGEPMTIPIHRLESGALLLFTFFMISDPKTTPNSRVARILYAFLVAAGAYYVTFKMFRTNGLLWSLVIVSLLVPFMDLLFRGEIYQWRKKDEVQFSS